MRQSINKGINFIKNSQNNDGFFYSFASDNPDNLTNGKKCPAIFSSALILQNLSNLEQSDETDAVKQKIANFLITQKVITGLLTIGQEGQRKLYQRFILMILTTQVAFWRRCIAMIKKLSTEVF